MRRALAAPKSSQCSIACGNSFWHARDVGVDQLVVAGVADPGVPLAQVHLVVEQAAGCPCRRPAPPAAPATGGSRPPRCRPRACRPRSRCRPHPGRRSRGCPRSPWPPAGRRRRAQPGVAQRRLDVLGVVDRQVHPARAAELRGELLDRQTRPSGCRRSAASPRCARTAACRTAPRCGCAGWSGTPTSPDRPTRGGTGRRSGAAARPASTPPRAAARSAPAPGARPGERRPPVDHRRGQHRRSRAPRCGRCSHRRSDRTSS